MRLASDFSQSGPELLERLRQFDKGERNFPEIGPPEEREFGTAFYDSIYYSVVEKLAKEIEAQNITFDGWATPGANQTSAALDIARTICRRGERRVWELEQSGELQNRELIKYLNRASDLLWLLARWVETKAIC